VTAINASDIVRAARDGSLSALPIAGEATECKRAEEENASLARFVEETPNPILRIGRDGAILYANKPAWVLLEAWNRKVGEFLPGEIRGEVVGSLNSGRSGVVDISCGGRSFSVVCVPVVNASCVNLYAHDFTDRMRLDQRRQTADEEALARTVEELARTNTEIEQFVYTVSHDLKSPLVTIQGFAGHIAQYVAEGHLDRLPDFIGRITDAASHMTQIIDDLLDLCRIGRVVSPAESVPMTELIRRIAEQHESQLTERGVILDIQESMPTIAVEKAGIEQVFDNLLVNALTHGCDTAEPRVAVGARVDGDEIRFFVRDNGQGIPPEYHDRIFGLFQRLKADNKGTGVGLAIVKRLVEAHGGRTWVESEAGQGATFWVALPKESVVAAE
jgi:signal transduction histidine kinase